MKRSEIILGLIKIPLDFGMTVAGLTAGYLLRLKSDFVPGIQFFWSPQELLPLDRYMEVSALFGGLLIAVFGVFGMYSFKNRVGPLRETRYVIKHSLVWMLLVMSYFFLTRKLFFSRLVLVYGFAFSILFLIIERLLLRQVERGLLTMNIGRKNILLLGKNVLSSHLKEHLKKDPHYHLIGVVEKIDELKEIAQKSPLDTLVVTEQHLSQSDDEAILELCRQKHIEYRFVPDILSVERSNVEIEPIAGIPVIHLRPTPLDGWGRIAKRGLDLIGSSMGLLCLSPIFLGIAIAIRLDSKGPILFSKLEDGSPAERVGLNGKPFTFYKFRSMTHNSHHLRSDLAQLSHRKGPLLKIKNDPRVTRVGKFLRRSSLDELPNLWNVFKGEMSLVGPRPHLPEEVSHYEGPHHFLLTVKPGITGLSQVSGRSDLDFEDEARLDSYYIKHWSLGLDLKILLKTIAVVLGGKAAD